MEKTKEEILKEKMSVEYCGETRFDFLDPEEIVMISQAMESYSLQQFKSKDDRIRELEEALRSSIRYTRELSEIYNESTQLPWEIKKEIRSAIAKYNKALKIVTHTIPIHFDDKISTLRDHLLFLKDEIKQGVEPDGAVSEGLLAGIDRILKETE
jgi:hypothetical protein